MTHWFNMDLFNFYPALIALAVVASFAFIGWLISIPRRDVSFVDGMWSLMFLLSLWTYMYAGGFTGWRAWLVLLLTATWSIRLSAYITWRNHGEGEDPRYQAIRENNSPNFEFKSVYIVFGLQALLAWIISFPLLAASGSDAPLNIFDLAGIAAWCAGMIFETVGDAQLARFKRNPANEAKVLNTGLWRYTRHPNYFGEFLLQWGFFIIALGAGGGWTIFAPLLISILLLKVSGVALLEKTISQRRPEYAEYVRNTNAFFPGRPRKSTETPALFIGLALVMLMPMGLTAEASDSSREWDFEVFVCSK